MAIASEMPLCAPSMVAAASSVPLPRMAEEIIEINTKIVQIQLITKETHPFICILCWKRRGDSYYLLQKVTLFEKTI